MNANVTKWIIESLIQFCADDKVLEHLLTALPLEDLDIRLKRFLLLWRIKTELYKAIATPRLLDMLDLVGELDSVEKKTPSEKMREAYCAVAVDCTVRYLELGDYVKYDETVEMIWRGRVRRIWEMDSSGLIDEKTLAWGSDIEAASSDEEIREKLLSTNNRCRFVKGVKRYLEEACEELGLFPVEMTAKDVFNEILGGVIGEEHTCQGMEDIINEAPEFSDENGEEEGFMDSVNVARNGIAILCGPYGEKLSEDESGEEQGFMDSVKVARNGIAICIPHEKLSEDENGEEQGFIDSVNEARNGIDVSGPCEKLSEDKIGEEQGFEGSGNLNEADISVAPTEACENHSEDDIMEEQGVEGLENKACNDATSSKTYEKPSAETPHRQLRKRWKSIGVRKLVACKKGSKSRHSKSKNLDKDTRRKKNPCISTPVSNSRRESRKWSVVEEDKLREGVKKFGRGKWKAILNEYCHIFDERTQVDLKDKWRNMTRYSR